MLKQHCSGSAFCVGSQATWQRTARMVADTVVPDQIRRQAGHCTSQAVHSNSEEIGTSGQDSKVLVAGAVQMQHRRLGFSAGSDSRPSRLLDLAHRHPRLAHEHPSLMIHGGRPSRLLDQEGAAHTVLKMSKALKRPRGRQLRRQLPSLQRMTLTQMLLSQLQKSRQPCRWTTRMQRSSSCRGRCGI